jgi:hypothetical protein
MPDDDLEVESDALREAEMMQAQRKLQYLVGRTIAEVRVEETRIAIVLDNAHTFFFYGYMGADSPE